MFTPDYLRRITCQILKLEKPHQSWSFVAPMNEPGWTHMTFRVYALRSRARDFMFTQCWTSDAKACQGFLYNVEQRM